MAPSTPLVSILIPCYNAQAFVAEAIDSALAQDYPNIEVIAVDDGSTDGTVDVLRRYGDRVRWETGPNRGGAAARNRALALSRGQFIQFLDADDVITSEKVRTQLPDLVADRADAVLCKIGLFGDERGRRMEKRRHPVPEGDPFVYFMRYPIQTAAPLHRREMLEKVGGFREGLRRGQEFDLHLRLGAAGVRLTMADQIMVWVRMHTGPRVSRTQQTAGESLELLSAITMEMQQRSQMTDSRAQLLAPRLFELGLNTWREGDRTAAAAAVQLARELDPRVRIKERSLVRLARRILGPLRAEAMLQHLRKLRRPAAGASLFLCASTSLWLS